MSEKETVEQFKERMGVPKRIEALTDPVECAKMALDLASRATVGPWGACHNGECSCKQVWTADHPVAHVEAGEWGDEWASIRIVGETSFDRKAEAFMEKIVYGVVPEEEAKANAQLIAFARMALPILANAVLAKQT